MLHKKVKTIEELEDYLIRLVSAYRRSYKFCSNIDKTITITAGIVSSSAVLALMPTVPIFLVVVGAVPAITSIFSKIVKISEKTSNLKTNYKKFKQLLSYVRSKTDDEDIIHYVFKEILAFQRDECFVEPFERYLKLYKLNGYE